jgi:hypothetical protein
MDVNRSESRKVHRELGKERPTFNHGNMDEQRKDAPCSTASKKRRKERNPMTATTQE